jgi:phosphatidyl-myo-inositol alpha-mannosyltransferase
LSSPRGRSLRVAMISYYLPSESKIGVGYQVHALANALVGRGHDVTIFSACEPAPGAQYTTSTIRPEGSNRTFKFALDMRRIDWSAFDVLHAHGDDYWLWRRRVPAHVRTLHGSCFSEARWISGTRERLRMVLLGLSEVLASIVADETVAVSANTRRWLPWVRTVIPNGVDLSRFQPGRRTSWPSILFVGTYRQRKRGELLVDVFEREVRPAFPECELSMVCEDAQPREGIRVLGRVSDDELASLYGSAWVFCLPSRYEGFGIPYVEAMASGCPVVATPNQGADEITLSGRLGVLAEDSNLGTELIALLSSPHERTRLAASGLNAVSRYDLDRVTAAYETLYRGLIDKRSASRPSTNQ